MKNTFKISVILMLFIAVGSCVPTLDSDLTVITPHQPPKAIAPTDGTIIVLDKEKPDETVTTIAWEYASYQGTQTVINYEVQIAKAGTNFNSINALVKTTTNLAKITTSQLNTAALTIGLVPSEAQDVEIRIKSYIGVNGVPQYSTPIKLIITPYPAWDSWGIIGSATPTGWESDTKLDYDLGTKKYSITIDMILGVYKFRKDSSWEINYGDTGNNLTLDEGGTDIPITADGNYTIVVDFNTKTYTVMKN
jgi:starch-binding outer membrane protein SusE/F